MMVQLSLVAADGALGAALRFVVSQAVRAPWGTFIVNVIGSLVLGFLSGWLARASGNVAAWRAFAVVGFCGGFTTFSTFSNEAFRMLVSSHWGLFAAYAAGSVAAGLAAVAIGYALSGSSAN